MNPGTVTALLLALLAGPIVGADPPTATVDLPADPTTLITPDTSEADLIARLGRSQVHRADIATGEGETQPGTLLFPDDPTRRLELLWHDPNRRETPAKLIVRSRESAWSIPPGIRIGTDLKTLEARNGRPFDLAGFDWDYEGSVTGWNLGRFSDDRTPWASLRVRLRPLDAAAGRYERLSAEEQGAVSGDRRFPSDDERMQHINPLLYEIMVSYPPEFHGASWQEVAKAPPWPKPYAGDVYQCRIVLGRDDWRRLVSGARDELDRLDAEFLDLNGDGVCEVIAQHSCGSDGCDGAIYTPVDGRLKEIGRANGYAFVVLLEPANGWLQLGEWFPRQDETWRYLSRYEGNAYRLMHKDRFDWDPQLAGKRYVTTERPLHQRLTAAAGVRLRAAPEPAAAVVATLPIGTPLTLTGEGTPPVRIGELEGPWYPVRSGEAATGAAQAAAGQGVSGWVFGPITLPFDPETPDSAYQTLLEAPGAGTLARPWADDIDLMMFIARHLHPDDPSHPLMLEYGTRALERIDDLADRDRFCGQHQGGLLDARSIYAELDALATAWPKPAGDAPRTPPQDGPPAPPAILLLQHIRLLVQACAAVHLRTLFEQEALGGIGLGSSEGDIERVTGCRFRRSAPEPTYQECCGFSAATWESRKCGMAFEIAYFGDGKTGNGTAYWIDLGEGFKGRTRLGIGIGSTREAFVAAYGRYWSEGDGSSSLEGKNGEYGPSLHFRFSAGPLVSIGIWPGHPN